MNLIQILLCLLVSLTIIFANLISFLESKLPYILSETFRYGKFAAATKSRLALQVPKSWFKHFYLLAFFEYSYILWLATIVYVYDKEVPGYIHFWLDTICGKERIAYTPKKNVYIAVFLMTLQVYRRLYETQKISVFGKESKMNLSHYLIGLFHYPAAALAILCEAPLFANTPVTMKNEPLNLLSISLSEKIAVLAFLIAWKHQFICGKILGDLRKNEKGDVVTSDYRLPKGDWFEYLSAPHQTAEIIMYSCIMWILWNNITWFFVFAWVLVNQVSTILLSHWWYQQKFDDFPKKRKALIPFLY